MTAQQYEWCKKIREYAIDHYNEDGWDYLVETMDNTELVDQFIRHKVSTYQQAFNIIHDLCKLLNSRREDIYGTIF
jgi:hypothetical protein